MHISAFDYELPAELIAQEPLPERDASRMLVVNRQTQTWTDSQFADLPQYLRPGDTLVINNTRVFPARLIGRREPSGGRVEVLLVRELEPFVWETLARPGRRLKPGAKLSFAEGQLQAEILDDTGAELRRVRFANHPAFEAVLEQAGELPLPPYITRPDGTSLNDRERYQTLFARESGAIAAPTAGLHFTSRVFEELGARDVQVAEITLHVGYGTFEPVRVEDTAEHRVAAERYEIGEAAANVVNETHKRGSRVVAVGTTTTRALESAINSAGLLESGSRNAELTIVPGFNFRIVDGLLTNFHLPRSSLLMLVSAFAGRDLILNAYRHAVKERYRFYSYGDCMLLL